MLLQAAAASVNRGQFPPFHSDNGLAQTAINSSGEVFSQVSHTFTSVLQKIVSPI